MFQHLKKNTHFYLQGGQLVGVYIYYFNHISYVLHFYVMLLSAKRFMIVIVHGSYTFTSF